MVCGLSALDLTIISYKPNLGITRIVAVLEALHAANQISDTAAEKSKQQYTTLTTAAHNEFKAQFQAYVAKQNDEIGLDTFYSGILMSNKSFSDLWAVVKMCLILSHGNVSVESGFSVNKSMLIENLHEETVVCQVYDAVLNCGELESVVIDRNLLQSIRHAHARYTEHLEAKHHKQQEEIQKKKEKKKLAGQVKRLENAKKRLREEAKMEEETIDEKLKELQNKKRKL